MLAKEYATAIFELASSNNVLNEIENEFNTLILAINENEDFMKVLTYLESHLSKKNVLQMYVRA